MGVAPIHQKSTPQVFVSNHFCVIHRPAKMICGGPTEQKPADEAVQKHCDAVKAAVEAKTGKKYDVFEAKHYISQVVAGTNYFVKVHVGNNECVHVRIYQTLPHAGSELMMHGVQEGKNLDHPVEYFEQNAGD